MRPPRSGQEPYLGALNRHVPPVRKQPSTRPRQPAQSQPPARPGRVLLALRAPGQGPVRGAVRRRLHRRRCSIRRSRSSWAAIVTLVTSSQPETLWTDNWPLLLGMAVVLLLLRPLAHDGAEPGQQPGDRGQRRQHDPLAEPLARGAPVLGVLPERFRRPHRQPGDADRPGGAREPRRADHRRLVHPGLRHRRADPARLRRPLAGAADRALVRRLPRDAARLRAAHARPLQGACPRRARGWSAASSTPTPTSSRSSCSPARATRTPMCARRSRSTPGCSTSSLRLNTLFSFCLSTLNAMLVTGTGGMAMWLWVHGKVEVGTVAMALPLSWQIVYDRRLGGDARHRDLREHRRGAGGHDDDRAADRADRQAGRRRAHGARAARSSSRTSASATAARTA